MGQMLSLTGSSIFGNQERKEISFPNFRWNLPTLLSRAPTRVLLPGVKPMERHWVQLEAQDNFFLWSRKGEMWARALEHRLPVKGGGRGWFTGIWAGGAEFSHVGYSCAAHARSKSRSAGKRLCARAAAAILNRSAASNAAARSVWGAVSCAALLH